MTIEDKELAYSIGAGGTSGDTGVGTAGGSGGGVATGSTVPPQGLGSIKTPMYFKSVLTPKTTAVSPYGNFIDISSKEQKLLWREMVKPDADFVALDMTVANSKAIINLFTDKAITICWMPFMRIPLIGDGVAGTLPNKTPSGRNRYKVALSMFKNLVEDFNHLSLKDAMAFASWFMGDLTTPRSVRPHNDMTMKYLDVKDVNATGNNSLVACLKQECRTVSCLV